MTKTRTLILLIFTLVILSAVTWGPMFWSGENTFSDGNAFVRRWSKVALYLYIPWALVLFLLTFKVMMYVNIRWVRLGIGIGMTPALLFVVSLGPLVHVCSLGVDCI